MTVPGAVSAAAGGTGVSWDQAGAAAASVEEQTALQAQQASAGADGGKLQPAGAGAVPAGAAGLSASPAWQGSSSSFRPSLSRCW